MKNRSIVGKAFYKSIPILAGYFVLGIGFGILIRNAGYGVLWAFSMSVFIYAGSIQYVGVGLLTGGASVFTTVVTTLMVNARHLFYSISMIDRYKDAGKFKPYLIFALTDEIYSLLCDGKVPEGEDSGYITYLGNVLPPAIIGMLVIYCLRNTSILSAPHGLPELLDAMIVVGLQVWKRNSLISILSGTAAYMLMVQVIYP